MKNFKIIALVAFSVILLTSCSKDDNNTPVNEEEVITTVRVTLEGLSETIVLESRDADGDGPLAPVLTPVGGGALAANTTYLGTVEFLNELVTPAADITEEVFAVGVDHQVFFQLPAAVGTVAYDDLDTNGKPVGLDFTLTTGATVGSGNFTVTLIHLPNKSGVGVSSGDITNAGGNTDAAVTFQVSGL